MLSVVKVDEVNQGQVRAARLDGMHGAGSGKVVKIRLTDTLPNVAKAQL